jgi:uncharacterized protein (DUF4415 family)
MKKVKRTTLSPLTAKQRREVAALALLPDDKIDYSDIPPLKASFWKNAVRNPFYRPVKQQLTVRLDSDVVAWLREQGKGYQTRINALLRAAMVKDVTGSSVQWNQRLEVDLPDIQFVKIPVLINVSRGYDGGAVDIGELKFRYSVPKTSRTRILIRPREIQTSHAAIGHFLDVQGIQATQ